MWVDPHTDVDLWQAAVCLICVVITDKLQNQYPLLSSPGRTHISSMTVQRSPSECNRKFTQNSLLVTKKYSLRLRKLITSIFFPQAKFIYPTCLFSPFRLFKDLNYLKSLSCYLAGRNSRGRHKQYLTWHRTLKFQWIYEKIL